MTDTTDQTDPTLNPAPTSESIEPKRSRRRTLLISGGAVLAAAVLVGGGVAVGAAIADEFDDDSDSTSDTAQPDDDDTGASADTDGSVTTQATGTASSSELLDIIEIASAEAEGEPVGIEAAVDGAWDVQFATDAGDESEVRVDAEGTAVVVASEVADPDEQTREGSLDARTLEALVSAALAHTDGTVIDIEVDGDTASPYDVSVLTADRTTVDITLDPEFKVLTADPDDN